MAALKKANANGGGVVYLPRGRYPVDGQLTIPDKTVLKGESTALVSLYWPDFATPPRTLLTGVSFGLDSLSLYCQNYKEFVEDSEKSDGTYLRHVRIRADGYFMMVEPAGRIFRDRKPPATWNSCEVAVRLHGKNFEVTDCDIYASGQPLFTFFAHVGLIARNRIFSGQTGFDLENADRLVFEDNHLVGASPLTCGNSVSSFWSAYCRNVWFARNHIEKVFGGDRETMTLDAGGGVNPGPLVSAEGTKLAFAKEFAYRTYHPVPLADYRGAAVSILDGKGAIQYRIVAKHQGREVEVDRPWTIPPDATSKIQIGPFRGHNLFVGNTIEDGGCFQLYAAANESIVAENKGARMDGFAVWGLNPHGWAIQPSWFAQFLDNEIVEGNGYGSRAASFSTIAYDETGGHPGPLVRGVDFPPQSLRQQRLDRTRWPGGRRPGRALHGGAFRAGHPRGAVGERRLLRDNSFVDVAKPIVDEGKQTVVIPK